MPQLLRQCHMKTHKSKGEKLLAAVSPQQSLIFKCIFYWAQSSYKMKSCFFDEREKGKGKISHNQLSWGFCKHFTFHHGNLWKCGVSMKILSPPGQVDVQVVSQRQLDLLSWHSNFIQEETANILKTYVLLPLSLYLWIRDAISCHISLISLHTEQTVICQSFCVKPQHIHAQLFSGNSACSLFHSVISVVGKSS